LIITVVSSESLTERLLEDEHLTCPAIIKELARIFDRLPAPIRSRLSILYLRPTDGTDTLNSLAPQTYTSSILHAGWLGQAVGEQNYRAFLLFLAVHTAMVWYGSVIVSRLLMGEVVLRERAGFNSAVMGRSIFSISGMVWILYWRLALLVAVLRITSLILTAFLGFHVYILCNGMTTNEYWKWKDVSDWHKQELSTYQQAVKNGTTDDASRRVVSNQSPCRQPRCSSLSKNDDNVDVTCTGQTTRQRRTTVERKLDEERAIGGGGGCPIHPGPMPRNIYNLGLLSNIMEVITPRSLRIRPIRTY
jgi:hypothetical protein